MHENPQTNSTPPPWQFDEQKHTGVNYAEPANATEYDARHAKFRDFENEARLIMSRLQLPPESSIIDFGCGTGALTSIFATQYKKLYAVDVSHAMLHCLEMKIQEHQWKNIETHCAGFLSYEHQAEPVDGIISSVALHHLPDFWKAVTLHRMRSMVNPGGKLYLLDVVFSFPVQEYTVELPGWIEGMRSNADDVTAANAIVHLRDEFSTFDWILEGMLERSGFHIQEAHQDAPFLKAYLCTAI